MLIFNFLTHEQKQIPRQQSSALNLNKPISG